MLTQLIIRDFAIVSECDFSLSPGLTVFTGETGAGKSILIDALTLTLGGRAGNNVIRHGCEQAEINACFDLKNNADSIKWLRDNDLDEDESCIIRRIIVKDKPSKAYINGRPVPIQLLRELGDFLVDVHGQHEHQSLLKRDSQRQILDDYGNTTTIAAQLRQQYEKLTALSNEISALKQQASDRDANLELLKYQVLELEEVAITPGSIETLEQEHDRLANGTELLNGVQQTVVVLDDSDNAVSLRLVQTADSLQSLVKFDKKLEGIVSLLNEASISVSEATSQLQNYTDHIEIDPEQLQLCSDRIAQINNLSRKHKVDAEQLPTLLDKLSQQLENLENNETRLDNLETNYQQSVDDYQNIAEKLSKKRAVAAKKLAVVVTQHMQELGMPGGSFGIDLQPLNSGPSATGLERVEFKVATNQGQPALPLTKIVSGGELSRISLALQVVIANLGRIPTLIFDEVDVGIGGRVAEIVGRQLKQLGQSRQVICITHLAHVAAQGSQHLQVTKLNHNGLANTNVAQLPSKERVKEIARMIGGIEISKQTLAHARDMLSRASS